MKREIKFKFWLGHTEKMTYPHYLSEIPLVIKYFTPDIIPLQFTGLKDKNGKEIYEGDILADGKDLDNPIGVVYYYTPQFCVQTKNDTPFALANGKVNMETLEYTEVIGNIYETPELLK